MEPATQRFWKKVEKTPDCWLWTRGTSRGYGVFWFAGKQVKAYRFAWGLTHGAIPDGMHIHHECFEKLCVRPDHLRLVTSKEHFDAHPEMMDKLPGMRAGTIANRNTKTHCNNGHPFTEANSYIGPKGYRQCRVCRLAAWHRHKRRARAHQGLGTLQDSQ